MIPLPGSSAGSILCRHNRGQNLGPLPSTEQQAAKEITRERALVNLQQKARGKLVILYPRGSPLTPSSSTAQQILLDQSGS